MGKINAGELDRRLTIKTPSEVKDEFGGLTVTWNSLATVWGKARPLSGREFLAAAQVVAGAQMEFTMWYRNDFDEKARIELDGVDYNVLYIAEIGFREGIMVLARKPT